MGELVVLHDGGTCRPWSNEAARLEDAGVVGGLALTGYDGIHEAVGPDAVGLGEEEDLQIKSEPEFPAPDVFVWSHRDVLRGGPCVSLTPFER